jgi:hypothetical protein
LNFNVTFRTNDDFMFILFYFFMYKCGPTVPFSSLPVGLFKYFLMYLFNHKFICFPAIFQKIFYIVYVGGNICHSDMDVHKASSGFAFSYEVTVFLFSCIDFPNLKVQ